MAGEDLGTMLNFLNQGSQSGGANIPQLGGEDTQVPQFGGQSMPQSGGAIGGLLHSIAGNYLQSKIAKYQDKQDAKELGDTYAPILEEKSKASTDPMDKAAYGEFAKVIKSGHPALQAIGMSGIKKYEEEKAKVTDLQRNYRDPSLRPMIEQEYANKGMPTIHTMGAPGRPGMMVNFYLDANKQPIPVGEPYKPGTGVSVNMGAPKSWIMPADAEKMVNTQGAHPPVGTEWGSPEAKGYSVATTQNQTDIKQKEIASNLGGELRTMLFHPKTGLYKDYGPNTDENKVLQTIKQNYQKYSQTDPRYKNADDYITANLAPAIKSLGTVGALSDSDVVRAQGLLPIITGINIDNPQVAKEKLDKFDRLTSAATTAISKGKRLSTSEVDKIIGHSPTTDTPPPEGWNDDLEKQYQDMLKSRGLK
jgi:hypothetical protein